MASLQAGKLDDAENNFKEVLRHDPKQFATLNLLAVVLLQRNRFDEAERYLQSALQIDARVDATFSNYGIALRSLKRPAEALEKFSKALELNPANFLTWNNRGTALNDLRRYDDAIADFDKALSLQADFVDAICNKANSLSQLKRHDEAFAAYGKALAVNPNLPAAWLGQGNLHLARKRYDDAVAAYDKALALDPGLADAWLGRGNVFMEQHRFDEALDCYAKAETIAPEFGDAHYTEGGCRLLLGDFERGWPKYEYRWRTRELIGAAPRLPQPLWLGDAPLQGKKILIHAEQGLGDTLMACRYVPMVAALGATVVFEVQESLIGLLSSLGGSAQLVAKGQLAKGQPLPDFDFHCPVMSLPLAFRTQSESIPAASPYLSAPPDKISQWRSRLGAGGPKIAIAWAGNPDFTKDSDRSITLKNILPALAAEGASFFSIQKDLRPGDREILSGQRHIVHLGDDIRDFQDTAAIMMCADLVISSDTAVVHLAGALGRPVWTLLSFNPDWRWLLGRDDSPWYPTAKLFRQIEDGMWGAVVDEVRAQMSQSLNRAGKGG